jgi:hypothetical protein
MEVSAKNQTIIGTPFHANMQRPKYNKSPHQFAYRRALEKANVFYITGL